MFSKWPIRKKLAALLAVPLLALASVAGLLVKDRLDGARRAREVSRLVDVASQVAPVVDQLQTERALVGTRLVGGADATVVSRWELQGSITNRAVASFAAETRSLESQVDGAWFTGELDAAVAQAQSLPAVRKRIAEGSIDSLTAQAAYTSTIDRLLGVSDRIAAGTDDPSLASEVSAYLSLARAQEDTAKQAGILAGAFAAGQVPDDAFAAGIDARASEAVHISEFRRTASAVDNAAYDELSRNVSVVASDTMRDGALAAPREAVAAAPGIWRDSMAGKRSQLARLDNSIRTRLLRQAADAESTSRRDALVYAGAAVLLLLITVLLAALLSRSIVRPVRRLTRAAADVADDLPGMVATIAKGGTVEPPEDLGVRGGEMGALATAFRDVRRVAIDVAGEQAALRAGIGEMFVNLARRNQALLERQLAFIDALEKEERDPDALENLFRLDHLSTRMRRNAESLLILGGAEPARRWRDAVLVRDVVRAAASEVEDYQRVRVPDTDLLALPGPVAAGLVHLLAELLENACHFSAPDTPVDVRVNQLDEVFTITVHDRGIGMSDEALAAANEKLATPPLVDATVSRHLGLFVVGRLASRLGLVVRLGRSAWGGVAAQVVLPAHLLSVASPAAAPVSTPASDEPHLSPALFAAAPAAPATPAAPAAPAVAPVTAMRSVPGASPLAPRPPGAAGMPSLPDELPSAVAAGGLARRTPGATVPSSHAPATDAGPARAEPPGERTPSGLARRIPRSAPAPVEGSSSTTPFATTPFATTPIPPAPFAPVAPGSTPQGPAGPAAPMAPVSPVSPVAPERVQSALSRFQAGLERGRAEAPAGSEHAGPDVGAPDHKDRERPLDHAPDHRGGDHDARA